MLEKLKKKYLNIPYALPWGEWDEWDKKAKKEHPIAFLLLITIPGYFGRMKDKLRNAVWWVKHRIIPRHRYHLINTKLPPEYYDIDVRMIYGCFSLLVDYVEIELPHSSSSVDKKNKSKRQVGLEALDSYIAFTLEEDQKDHADMYQQIKDLYLWWNDDYLKRDPNDFDYDTHKHYISDNEKLIQLVKLRGFMWT